MVNAKTKVTEYTYETKVTCYEEQVNADTSLFWQRCVCPCSGRTMITAMILRKTSDTTLVGSVETYPEAELNASDCYMWHVFMKPAMEEAQVVKQS